MIAYKVTNNNQCILRGTTGAKLISYELGKTYEFTGTIIYDECGFHFCKEFNGLKKFCGLSFKNTIIYEIEVLGDIIDGETGSVTNKFKTIKVIPKSEYFKLSGGITNKDGQELTVKNGDTTEENTYENGKLIECKGSDGRWGKFTYDNNGNNLIMKWDNGATIEHTYDEDNNPINVLSFPDSAKSLNKPLLPEYALVCSFANTSSIVESGNL